MSGDCMVMASITIELQRGVLAIWSLVCYTPMSRSGPVDTSLSGVCVVSPLGVLYQRASVSIPIGESVSLDY